MKNQANGTLKSLYYDYIACACAYVYDATGCEKAQGVPHNAGSKKKFQSIVLMNFILNVLPFRVNDKCSRLCSARSFARFERASFLFAHTPNFQHKKKYIGCFSSSLDDKKIVFLISIISKINTMTTPHVGQTPVNKSVNRF